MSKLVLHILDVWTLAETFCEEMTMVMMMMVKDYRQQVENALFPVIAKACISGAMDRKSSLA